MRADVLRVEPFALGRQVELDGDHATVREREQSIGHAPSADFALSFLPCTMPLTTKLSLRRQRRVRMGSEKLLDEINDRQTVWNLGNDELRLTNIGMRQSSAFCGDAQDRRCQPFPFVSSEKPKLDQFPYPSMSAA
jgi:hypothetical protein